MIRNRTGANARGTPRLPPSAAVGVITSDDVINNSTVPGATVTDALDSLAGAGVMQSWASTLTVGSVSGGTSPQVSDGDNLEFLAATPVATDGRIRGAQGFSIMGRDAGNAANAPLLDWGTVADTLVVGGSSFPTVVNSADSSGLALATGAVARLTLSAALALLSVSPLEFASGVTTPTIDQAATGGATGEPLTVQAQNAATTGGDVVVTSGTGATAGNVDLRTGGISRLLARPVAVDLNVPLLQFLSGVTAPAISQQTTGGATGQPLAITAQAAATTGGNVVLSGGSGGTTQGSVDVANDSPLRFTGASPTATTGSMRVPHGFNLRGRRSNDTQDLSILDFGVAATDRVTLGNSTFPVQIQGPSTNGVRVLNGAGLTATFESSGVTLDVPLFQFAGSVTAPTIRQATTGGAAGQPLAITAQAAATTGGNLVLSGGSGGTTQQGSVDVANDSPLRLTGATPTAQTGDMRARNIFNLNIRNGADSADLNIINTVSVLAFGNTTMSTRLVGSLIDFNTVSGTRMRVANTEIEVRVTPVQFQSTLTAPVLQQAATGGATGQPLTVQAQNAATTGGNLVLTGGSGGTTQGSVDIANDSPLRFTGASPTATTGSMRVPTGWTLMARNAGNTVDRTVISKGAAVTFGDSGEQTTLEGSLLALNVGGTARAVVTTTVFEFRVSTVQFDTAVTAPVFQQESRGAGAGETLSIHSQDTTDAAANGGALAIRSGTGGATSGESGALLMETPDSAGESGDLTIQVGDVSTAEVRAGTLSILGGDGGGGEGGVGGNVIVQPGIGGGLTTGGRIELNHAGGNTAIDIAQTADAHLGGQAILITSAGLGFFDGSPTERPSVTGIRDSNAALASVLTVLDSMGLITDNTTAT